MKDNRRPLIIPPAAEADANAIEMARVWIAQRKLHCVLNIGHWLNSSGIDERDAWGIVLADIARHEANALEEAMGGDTRENLNRILEAFELEIRNRTSEHDGEWPEGKPRSAVLGRAGFACLPDGADPLEQFVLYGRNHAKAPRRKGRVRRRALRLSAFA